ncbi:hypothetical protein O6H91_02G059900 [Diphasiastrum complanatum]|uniref:Uncharacterized protein n=1 Tax=Diphasiastrum complanatum TaxID=34168 RepID=A0ACC2EG16_DIPCM|nr:hypothetical protein O6H91_02G059900 [Diphasiastrum complanatum]
MDFLSKSISDSTKTSSRKAAAKSYATKVAMVGSSVGVTSPGASKTLAGKVHNIVSLELGRKTYNQLRNDPSLTLEKIHYCQSELSSVTQLSGNMRQLSANFSGNDRNLEADEDQVKKKRLINHDFLVFELHTNVHPIIYVTAEKAGNGDKIGIIISVDKTYNEDKLAKYFRLFAIECKGKKIGLEYLFDVLEDHPADYRATNMNCWEYAKSTTKRVLLACQRLPEVDDEEKQRLKKEMEAVEGRIMGNLVEHNFKRAASASYRASTFNLPRNSSAVQQARISDDRRPYD